MVKFVETSIEVKIIFVFISVVFSYKYVQKLHRNLKYDLQKDKYC